MVANATDIRKGMEVFGSAGEKIGSVADVYPYVGEGGAGAPSGTSTPLFEEVIVEEVDVAGPASGSTAPFAGSPSSTTTTAPAGSPSTAGPPVMTTGYFKVDQGGILGIGAKHLYVPFDAVDDVVPEECVTLSCAKDECVARYGTKPDFLQDDQSS